MYMVGVAPYRRWPEATTRGITGDAGGLRGIAVVNGGTWDTGGSTGAGLAAGASPPGPG